MTRASISRAPTAAPPSFHSRRGGLMKGGVWIECQLHQFLDGRIIKDQDTIFSDHALI